MRVSHKSPHSESSDAIGDEEYNEIPSLAKQLNDVNPVNLPHPKRTQGETEYGLRHPPNSSSEEEGCLTGRSRLPLPEMPNPTRNSKSTKLPSFLQKPTLRPTAPPVEAELDRLAQNVKTDKLGRIVDCLGTLADKGPNTTDESQLSRLAELTVFALRGCGSFSTHLGTGVYGPVLGSTLRRQSLSSKPMTWDAGIRALRKSSYRERIFIFELVLPKY